MSRMKKPLTFVSVGVLSAAAALIGTQWVPSLQFAHARDAVETARHELAVTDVSQMSTVFRKVGKVMEPSVVNILVHKSAKTGKAALPFDDETLKKFFPDRNGDGEPDLPEGFGDGAGPENGSRESVGTGSGVIIEVVGGSGFILTNNHVAGGATDLSITLADGREIKNGKVLGTDPKTDLAVIKIEADRLIPAKWGDSDELQRGDFVMAFGSPFGYIGSMTHGIVSALNRQAGIISTSQGYEQFIQVDCPINPGNSGGPLTNLKGEVVGVNTAIATRSGGFQGIGFAIPSNQAKYVYSMLKDKGKVIRGWLGVSISDVARDVGKAQSFGYKGEKGVLVEQTFANTPATGKLQPGDIVTEVDGKAVENVQALRNTVAVTAPKTDVKMKVFRDGKFEEVSVKIGEQPDDLMAAAGKRQAPGAGGPVAKEDSVDALGLRLSSPNAATLERFGLGEVREGAVVTQVSPVSAAAKAGIRPGDVITKVGNTEVRSAKDASNAIAKEDLKKGVRLYVVNATGGRFVFVMSEE